MKTPIFLLDVDDVLAEFMSVLADFLNRHDPRKEWTVDEWITDVSHETWCNFFEEVKASDLPVATGAQFFVEQLRQRTVLYIVTSYLPMAKTWTHDRHVWLAEHFGIPTWRVIHTQSKHLVRGDYLLDDKPINVENWQKSNPEGKGLLWTRPHNRKAPAKYRMNSWDEVLALVEDDLYERL